MKKLITFLLLVSCAIHLCACGKGNDSSQSSPAIPEPEPISEEKTDNTSDNEFTGSEYDEEVISTASFFKKYDTTEVLEENASVVIEGSVVRTTLHLHKVNDDIVPYTLFELHVKNVIKGNVEKDSTILVAEYGGIITAEEAGFRSKYPDMSDEDANKRILVSFGNQLPKPRQQLLLFLSDDDGYQILSIDTPYYMIVGEYYGMFIHDASSSYIQNLPSYMNESERIVIEDINCLN